LASASLGAWLRTGDVAHLGCEAMNSTTQALIDALDRYMRQDETAGDTDNGVYRQGQQAMSGAISQRTDPWRQAVDEALIAHALDCTGPSDDPKEKVKELIEWAVTIATDPRVSDASRVRDETLEQAAQLYGEGEVAAPGGHSQWGDAHQEGWIDGTKAYRDAIRSLIGAAKSEGEAK